MSFIHVQLVYSIIINNILTYYHMQHSKIVFFVSLLIFSLNSSKVLGQDILLLKTNGKVVIGDTSLIATPGDYQLYVQNGVLTERVKVSLRNQAEWSDDAWDKLPSLIQVQQSIESKQHLFDMPSAASLVEEGYELKDMDAKLLQQIEWIWMYVLELEKKNALLEKKLAEIQSSEK